MPAFLEGPSISHLAMQTRGDEAPSATWTSGSGGNSVFMHFLGMSREPGTLGSFIAEEGSMYWLIVAAQIDRPDRYEFRAVRAGSSGWARSCRAVTS